MLCHAGPNVAKTTASLVIEFRKMNLPTAIFSNLGGKNIVPKRVLHTTVPSHVVNVLKIQGKERVIKMHLINEMTDLKPNNIYIYIYI